jgi:hypothetical protein
LTRLEFPLQLLVASSEFHFVPSLHRLVELAIDAEIILCGDSFFVIVSISVTGTVTELF